MLGAHNTAATLLSSIRGIAAPTSSRLLASPEETAARLPGQPRGTCSLARFPTAFTARLREQPKKGPLTVDLQLFQGVAGRLHEFGLRIGD